MSAEQDASLGEARKRVWLTFRSATSRMIIRRRPVGDTFSLWPTPRHSRRHFLQATPTAGSDSSRNELLISEGRLRPHQLS
jgi:hypothetical protein